MNKKILQSLPLLPVSRVTVKESRVLNLCRSVNLWEKSGGERLLHKVFREDAVLSSREERKGNLEHL